MRPLLDGKVKSNQAIGQIKQDFEEFKVNAPLLLFFHFERLFGSAPLDHGHGLARNRQHEAGKLT
jgi:hypothetical protein